MNLVILCFAATVAWTGTDELTAEGKARQAAHRFLFDKFCDGRETKFKGKGSQRILDEVVIAKERIAVKDDTKIPLPDGSERVASMFRYIVLRGENLDNIQGLSMEPYSLGSFLERSTVQPKMFRAKVTSMPVPSENMPAMVVVAQCKPGKSAVVTEIAFNSHGKLSTIFNDIPYRNLGANRPRKSVSVVLDPSHEWSIGGHVDLEREKFFRYYAAPGRVHRSFEKWAAERNFLPGRQILKFQPSLVERPNRQKGRLQESPSGNGAADLSYFDKYSIANPTDRAIDEFKEIDYAMCFNDFPEFMSVKRVGRGTPLVENFDQAADLAAAYIESHIKTSGRSATWWEAKNESTIKAEWDYHWKKDVDSWGLLADFHNRVADAVHAKAPGIKVGGPSSAWMQLHVKDFGLYRNQARFMDETKGRVDFYSHHFYENFGSLGAWERRENVYTGYLLGRLEATLDMLVAHMHETDNVKPILITECGSLQPGLAPSDYWLRLRSFSAYTHKFLQRPDTIDLSVPFAFMNVPWNPRSGNAAFIPKDGKPNHAALKDCRTTPVKYFFEFWRDFDGRRIPVQLNQPWLDATAVHQGNRLQVALTNMSGSRLAVDLQGLDGIGVESIFQRRLFYEDGEVKYEEHYPLQSAASISVDVEETTLVTFQLNQPLKIQAMIRRDKWFAPGTAMHTKDVSKSGFEIQVDETENIESAELVVGVYRQGGLGGKLTGEFNGKPFKVNADWAQDSKELFTPIRIPLPVKHLQKRNRLKIDPRKGLVITSIKIVTDSIEEE